MGGACERENGPIALGKRPTPANFAPRAFLPASQVDTRRVNDLDPYVGKPLMVKLIELNRKRNRVIISHRAITPELRERWPRKQ